MESLKPTTFVRLRDSELAFANPEDDIRGHKVLDVTGSELGEVKSLFVDEENSVIRLFELASGGILGLGGATRLMPVEAILDVSDETVRVAPTREHVQGAPAYEPDLTERGDVSEIYDYYGYRWPMR
jgi:hypothetical protein